jgi:mannose-6-phosphate isomerase-like protein (cupin superfamily)
MLIKDIKKLKYIKVIDETTLCELLHPANEDVDLGCSLAHAILEPGKSSLPHRLFKSVEIYYILEGKGVVYINGEEENVQSGQAIYIPPNARQWIENISDHELKFLCIVTPPWNKGDEELC